ncbi:hypothetical protein B0T20DRAFT_100165 [Sordaria brevicollis]|uniref:Mid2 domain-containing protein n=1 Tax=Sordaria brevicollis TaxID=83679 RepID=A0AAE0NWE6_SORBR|nr:hypothetical protein B0T20DRAFT_100165 [Sordaria brevicollis]
MLQRLLGQRPATALLLWVVGIVLIDFPPVQAYNDYTVDYVYPKAMDSLTGKRTTFYQNDVVLITYKTDLTVKEISMWCGPVNTNGQGPDQAVDVRLTLPVTSDTKNIDFNTGNTVLRYRFGELYRYPRLTSAECFFKASGHAIVHGETEQHESDSDSFILFHQSLRPGDVPQILGPDGAMTEVKVDGKVVSTIRHWLTTSTSTIPPPSQTAISTTTGISAAAAGDASPTTPPTNSTAEINDTGAKKEEEAAGGLSKVAIIGIGAGGGTLVVIIAVLSFLLFWTRRKSRGSRPTGASPDVAASSDDGSDNVAIEKGGHVGGGGGGGGGAKPEKGSSLPYFKAELEDTPSKPQWNELDGTCYSQDEKKEKLPQVAELGGIERRHDVNGGDWQHRYELA